MTRILVFGLLCSVSLLFAQSEEQISQLQAQVNAQKSGQSRFLMRGYAHSGLEATEERSSFVGGSFNPIFLWQQSDRLLFEAELELELEEGQTHLTLEYANMSYFLNDWATLRLGKFLMPFGIFAERIHPRWINRLPSNPLGFGHESVGPISGLGAEIRGGAQFGASKINYAVYATNGPVCGVRRFTLRLRSKRPPAAATGISAPASGITVAAYLCAKPWPDMPCFWMPAT